MAFLLWHGVSNCAAKYADRSAVHDATVAVTYAQLEEDSARMAALLHAWGVGRGDRVAILMPKSVRSVITMIGVSKSGAAYVPVDPGAPAARSSLIISNARVRVLVTSRRLLAALEEFLPQLTSIEHIIVADADYGDAPPAAVSTSTWAKVTQSEPVLPRVQATEFDPAYILYTSGSTGTPKGVVISHRNALTFIDWARETFDVANSDRLSNHAPLHFDLSVFDIYCALHSGASVHLVPDRIAAFPMELARWINDTRITIWYSVPSALIRLHKQGALERFQFEQLRMVPFAGEVFPVKHLRPVMDCFRHAMFYNLYGPTETNVCTWLAVPRPLPEEITDLSIGHSCANFEAFAVTSNGSLAEVGQEGELLVRGPGVALGYWGLPERTAQSFTQNPLHSDYIDLVYRTGDIVIVAADGSFTFIGRRDHMVKTRGYRVELGDIEHALHQHPAVAAAVAFAVPDDEVGARLWAAVVPEAPLTAAELTTFCNARLPHYSVPEQIVLVTDLPRTSTGKVDRQALSRSIIQSEGSQLSHA
jgi:amino acid adenylation domain-containing protein